MAAGQVPLQRFVRTPIFKADDDIGGHRASDLGRGRPRLDGRVLKIGSVTKVLDGFDQHNGICFSPDGKRVYICESAETQRNIRVADVDLGKGTLANGKVFASDLSPSGTDGVRCDTAGNVWCSMGWGDPKEDGVRCYAPDGTLTGKIHLPETCGNLAWGSPQRNRLYMCASTSIYAVYLNAQGATWA